MRYLVLGSEGQIGRALVKYIKNAGDSVVEFDIKRGWHEDLRQPVSELGLALTRCDFVFFLAWDVGGSKYLTEMEETFEFIHNNIQIMQNVFSMLKAHNKPFLFTSSQMASMVHSVYGNTKLLGERYTKSLGGLNVSLWNVYGPESEDIKSHVITDFVSMALNTGRINMRTTGEELRQFLYVEDCCSALYTASKMYDKIPRDKKLHLSSFEWVSIKKVAEMVASLCGCQYFPGVGRDNIQMQIQVEPELYFLNFWKPQYSLKCGIKKIVESFNEPTD